MRKTISDGRLDETPFISWHMWTPSPITIRCWFHDNSHNR